eukprot:1193464-Prorocentrum_minimum.AAC.1
MSPRLCMTWCGGVACVCVQSTAPIETLRLKMMVEGSNGGTFHQQTFMSRFQTKGSASRNLTVSHPNAHMHATSGHKSKEPVRCTQSLLLGILGVHNVGNQRFGRVCPIMYCTTNPDGFVPNEGSTSEVVDGHGV